MHGDIAYSGMEASIAEYFMTTFLHETLVKNW